MPLSQPLECQRGSRCKVCLGKGSRRPPQSVGCWPPCLWQMSGEQFNKKIAWKVTEGLAWKTLCWMGNYSRTGPRKQFFSQLQQVSKRNFSEKIPLFQMRFDQVGILVACFGGLTESPMHSWFHTWFSLHKNCIKIAVHRGTTIFLERTASD